MKRQNVQKNITYCKLNIAKISPSPALLVWVSLSFNFSNHPAIRPSSEIAGNQQNWLLICIVLLKKTVEDNFFWNGRQPYLFFMGGGEACTCNPDVYPTLLIWQSHCDRIIPAPYQKSLNWFPETLSKAWSLIYSNMALLKPDFIYPNWPCMSPFGLTYIGPL